MSAQDPRDPWQGRVPLREYVAGALAYARPAGAAQRAFPPAVDPDELAARYQALRAEMVQRLTSHPASLQRLTQLEQDNEREGHGAWVPLVLEARADEAPETVALARWVWQALGESQYTLALRPRPETYRGFLEGRVWMLLGIGVLTAGFIAASEGILGSPWWWALIVPGCLALLLIAYRRRVKTLLGRPGAELPHF